MRQPECDRADGPDAEQAVEALAQLVASGFGEP
jgi:phosphotransferase system HPr-like phosphotransfer protein